MKNLNSKSIFSVLLSAVLFFSGHPAFAASADLKKDLQIAGYAVLVRDHEFAERKYSEITQKYPQEASGWFALAEYLFHREKTAEAEAAYLRALSIDSRYRGANLKLGMIAYRSQDYTKAVSYLENEKKVKGQKADAQYWLARVYEAQQNWPAAAGAYSQAEKKSIYSDLAGIGRYEALARSGELPQASTESERPWDLRIGSGFVYTDNVAASDDKTLRPADTDQRWDFGWNYDLAASYRAIDTEHFDLTARYDLDHLIYFESEDLNQLTNRIQLDPETHFGNWTLGSNLFWEHQTLGGDAYRYVWGVRPWVGYRWNRFQFVTGYEWNDGQYHFTPANGKQNRDNEVHKMDHGVVYYPAKYFSYFNLGLNYGEERAKGSDYNRQFFQTYFALSTREWHEISLNSSLYTGWNNHLQPDTGALITESQRRRGQDFGFHVEVVKRFGDSGFRVYGRYEYDRRASNITFYSSTTNTVTTGVKYDF